MEKKLLTINLRMFDGGTAAGSASGAGTAVSGDGGAKGETLGAVPGSTRRGKSGEFANVRFGKQPSGTTDAGAVNDAHSTPHAAGEETNPGVQQSAPSTLEDRRKAFREMVNGEFKDVFTEEMQRIINRRFSDTRTLESQMQAQQPIIDMLLLRHNIADGDMKKLSEAMDKDTAFWREAAEEAGMSEEQYKVFLKSRIENAAYKKAEEGRQQNEQARERARADARRWYQEGEALKARFPNFDLEAELTDPYFVSMLRSGTPVEHAYKVKYFDEIMQNAMQITATTTEKQVVDSIRAKGTRPAENGISAQSAFTIRDDASKLTKRERAEIARQAMRGEKIVF